MKTLTGAFARKGGRVLLLLVALGWATWIWPTLYRPITVREQVGSIFEMGVATRENRFTGTIEMLVEGMSFVGWVRVPLRSK